MNASCHVNALTTSSVQELQFLRHGSLCCVWEGIPNLSGRRLLHPPPSDGSRVVRDFHVAHVNRFQDSYIDIRLFKIVMESKNFDLRLGNGHTQSRYYNQCVD